MSNQVRKAESWLRDSCSPNNLAKYQHLTIWFWEGMVHSLTQKGRETLGAIPSPFPWYLSISCFFHLYNS